MGCAGPPPPERSSGTPRSRPTASPPKARDCPPNCTYCSQCCMRHRHSTQRRRRGCGTIAAPASKSGRSRRTCRRVSRAGAGRVPPLSDSCARCICSRSNRSRTRRALSTNGETRANVAACSYRSPLGYHHHSSRIRL